MTSSILGYVHILKVFVLDPTAYSFPLGWNSAHRTACRSSSTVTGLKVGLEPFTSAPTPRLPPVDSGSPWWPPFRFCACKIHLIRYESSITKKKVIYILYICYAYLGLDLVTISLWFEMISGTDSNSIILTLIESYILINS